MRLLLDTNALLWAAVSPNQLTAAAARAITDPGTEVLISAASAWEIATKVRLGKLPEASRLEQDFVKLARSAGYSFLAIDVGTALRSGRMPGTHRDPFDRMIAAQALQLDIPVVSADASLDGFGVRRIW